MISIIFMLIKTSSEPLYPGDAGAVILEEATPIRIEMFPHRIKQISQNHFVLIFSKPSF